MGFWSRLIDILNFRRRLPPPEPKPTPSPENAAAVLVMEINKRRADRGLSPVVPDPRLDVVAQEWAMKIAEDDCLSHGDTVHRLAGVYPAAPWGEDIAMALTPAEVVSMWEHDVFHSRIMLGGYDHIGVGIALSRSGWSYWVADFALVRPRTGNSKA